tara:strand:+ start:1027 stop:1512 length:486 start_codon:yes stop_codon:yes gene_type:complete
MTKLLSFTIAILLLFSCSSDEEGPIEQKTEADLEQLLAGKWRYTKRFYIKNGEETLSQDECSLMRNYTFFETGNVQLEYWGGDGNGGCEIWETITGDWAVGKDPNDERHNIILQTRENPNAQLETRYALAELISENVLHLTFFEEDEDDMFGDFKLHLQRE